MNGRIVNIIVSSFVVLAIFAYSTSTVLATTPFTDIGYFFSMPNELKDSWTLESSNVNPDNGKSKYIYNRKVIVDHAGRRIIPGMILTFESLRQKMDLTLYAGILTTQLGKNAQCVVDKVEPLNNTLLFKIRFWDKFNVEHTSLLQFGILHYKGAYYGVLAWLDGTTPVFPQVEGEMKKIVLEISKSF